jgi:hypothetical protein
MTPAFIAQHLARDPLDAAVHLGRGAARKGHQEDAARIGAADDQMRDAVSQRVGLAGSRRLRSPAEERGTIAADAMLNRAPLRRVQRVEIWRWPDGRIKREHP